MTSSSASDPEYCLSIPFAKKDMLKQTMRIKWNPDAKMWVAPSKTAYDMMTKYHVVKLNVHFKYKDECKVLGAQWNGRHWHVNRSVYEKNEAEFLSYMAESNEYDFDSD